MKFKPSIAFDEFSGSAGNVTAAKINGRSYIKRKPIPTNPNTVKQQEVRNRFKEIAKAYKALTQEKKNAWDSKSKQSLSRAIFGVKATLSGINLFQQVNQNLAVINAPFVDTPATNVTEFPQLSLISVDGSSTGVNTVGENGVTSGLQTLVFNKFELPESIAIVVRMSAFDSKYTKFKKSETRIISTAPTMLQLQSNSELNNLQKDVTIIPLGQPWTDVYHLRPDHLDNYMISVELISKSDGSMISVLEYVGNAYGTNILKVMIDDKNELTKIN